MSTGERTPPTIAAADSSSPVTPNPKRAKMGCPDRAVKTPEEEGQSTERAQPLKSQGDDTAATEAALSSEKAGAADATAAQPSSDDVANIDDNDLDAVSLSYESCLRSVLIVP